MALFYLFFFINDLGFFTAKFLISYAYDYSLCNTGKELGLVKYLLENDLKTLGYWTWTTVNICALEKIMEDW